MKPCRKCEAVKPADEFYENGRMADGRLNTCKECYKAEERARNVLRRPAKQAAAAERLAERRAKWTAPEGTKKCRRCHETLALGAFTLDPTKRGGHHTICSSCRARGYVPRNRHADHIRLKYGLTPERYDAMLESQQGVCALCFRSCPTGKRLAVDHCHTTGRIRKLLCIACNRTLGQHGDDSEWFYRAGRYLSEVE